MKIYQAFKPYEENRYFIRLVVFFIRLVGMTSLLTLIRLDKALSVSPGFGDE
jgi:hypothetical protein